MRSAPCWDNLWIGLTAKKLLLWIAGMLVAAGITILPVVYIVDRFIDPYNRAPL
jgi:hypothetical protein